MHRINSRTKLALSLLAAFGAHCGQAQAGMMLTPSFYKGSDTVAAGTLQTTGRPNGDLVSTLSYDFNQGGLEAAANLTFDKAYPGTHVRLRLRAPATASLALRVKAATPTQQTTIQIDRTNAKADASGWETHTLALPAGAAWNIAGASVLVNAPSSSAPVGDKAGAISYRGIEVWSSAPPASGEPSLNKFVTVTTAVAATAVSPVSSLASDGNYTGDDIQRVSYNFASGGFYAGVQFMPAASVYASFARFRVWAAAGTRIMLRIERYGASEPWFYLPNSRGAVDDGTGWVSYVVPLSSAQENIQSVAVLTQQPNAPQSGTMYVKDMELLDHAPSPHEPLAPLNVPVFSSVLSQPYPSDKVISKVVTTATSAGPSVRMPYDFTNAGQYASASVVFTLDTAVKANRLRFMAMVPLGTPLSLKYSDAQNNVIAIKPFKPLAVADDAGWVPYVIKLDPLPGPVKTVTISVDRSANNSNITTASLLEANTLPNGTAYFKQITLGNEPDQLDLTPTLPGLAGAAEKGSLPWSIMGVVTHDPVGDRSHLQELGLMRVRYGYSWEGLEAPNGQSPLDVSAVVSTTNDYLTLGIKPMVLLAYNNRKYSIAQNVYDHAKIGLSGPVDDANRAAFVNYAKAITAPFASNPNVSFEIWNEPNHTAAFWAPEATSAELAAGKPAQEYSALLSETATGVGAGLPLISGGLAGINFPYLHALSKTPAFAKVNRLGLHPYSDAMPELAGEGGAAALAMIRKNADDLHLALPVSPTVWVTEVGHSSNKVGAPFLSDVKNADGTVTKHSRDPGNLKRQAILVARQMLTSAATGAQMHMVFRMRDEYICKAYDSNESNYGLYSVSYPPVNCNSTISPADRLGSWSEKPVTRAVKTLRKAMDGRTYQGMITGSPSNVQAMKLEAAGKETVYVVWANGNGAQANVTVAPSCDLTRGLDGELNPTSSCISDVENKPLTCAQTGVYGRLSCPVSDENGPIFVRTKRAS